MANVTGVDVSAAQDLDLIVLRFNALQATGGNDFDFMSLEVCDSTQPPPGCNPIAVTGLGGMLVAN